MKQPTGPVRPRRAAVARTALKVAPKAAPPKPRDKVRLDLKRRPAPPPPEPEIDVRHQGNFWRWVVLVGLLHVAIIFVASVYFAFTSYTKPPVQFISLLPQGDVVKGNPGAQQAHKIGTITPANIEHHSAAKPPPTAPAKPKTVTPVKLTPPPPKPDPTSLQKAIVKPPTPKPPKPVPAKPKVKVDLNLEEGPVTPADKLKPKLHAKKPVLRTDDTADDNDSQTRPDSPGLSREQVAARLGAKLDAEGVKSAQKIGKSGDVNGHANDFSGFYAMVRDQVMSHWTSPNLTDETTLQPVVEIFVEKDGRVPAERVHLVQSSGNPAYDDSAVAAAKGLGYLHEPLPDGCNPTMTINFKLTR